MLFYKDGADLCQLGQVIRTAYSPGRFYELQKFTDYQRTLEFKSAAWTSLKYMQKEWLFSVAYKQKRPRMVDTLQSPPISWRCLLRRSL